MSKVIEKTVVEGLARDIGAELIPTIAQSVASDLTARLETLRVARDAKEASGVREQAHALKSAARTIGLMTLGDQLASLEIAAMAEAWGEIEAGAEALDQLAADSQQALESLITDGLDSLV